MRKSISLSAMYLNKLKGIVNVIMNMHDETRRYLNATAGYFGSDRETKLISFEIIGGGNTYLNEDIITRCILGNKFINSHENLMTGFFTTKEPTIVLEVCIMDDEMNTLPLWKDDKDKAYIILPYLPGIHKFFKKLSKYNFNVNRFFNDHQLTNWDNWEKLSTYMSGRGDYTINKYELFYNNTLASFFGADVWNYFEPKDKFHTARTLVAMELWTRKDYKNTKKDLYGLSHVGFVVDISDDVED